MTLRELIEVKLQAIEQRLTDGQEAATREHAQVRRDLAQLGMDFRGFKQHVYDRFGSVRKDIEPLQVDLQQRTGGQRTLDHLWVRLVAASTIVGVVAGLCITAIRSFIPAA